MTPALFNTPQKVSTTVRLDLGLKRQAEEYARAHHMDFTTFLSFSLQSTMRFGGRTESYYKISAEYAQEIDDLVHRIDTWEEEIYGSFEWKEATDFLRRSI